MKKYRLKEGVTVEMLTYWGIPPDVGQRMADAPFMGEPSFAGSMVFTSDGLSVYGQMVEEVPADDDLMRELAEALRGLLATYDPPNSGTFGAEQPLWDAAHKGLAKYDQRRANP